MKVREPQWLLSGGSVPKFQKPASGIWRKYLFNEAKNNYNRYVTTPDLWDKTHDVDRIFNDVTAIEGFATNWNPETLNALNSVNKERTLNKLGYKSWNESFDQLGLNENYFGKDTKLFDYMGPTTWNRIAFMDKLKGKYNSKDNALKTDYGDYYFDPTQNKWVPTTQPNTNTVDNNGITGNNPVAPLSTQTGDNSQSVTNGNNPLTTNGNNPIRLTFDKPLELKKQPLNWSDWIPLTAQLTGDLLTNSYLNQQQKKMRFSLKEAPYLYHKVTNDYYARTGLKLAADQVRQKAGQYITSDINQDLRIREQAEKQAQEYEKQAASLKANTFARESQLAEETRNKNTIASVDTANYNRQQNAAAWNNILNANQQQAAKNLQAVNSYFGNMYQSLGEALKTKRLNEQGYQKAYNQYLANQKAQEARSAYLTNSSDLTKWDNLEGALEAFLSEGSDVNPYRLDNSGWQATGAEQIKQKLTDAQKRLFMNWLQNSTSEGAQLQRANWQRYQDQVKSNYYDLIQSIQNELEQQNLEVPAFVDNQWNLFNWNTKKKSKNSPLWPSKKKEGGIVSRRMDRFSDFTRQYQRELQHVRKSQDERNKTSLKHLDKQLERLNREQIILLRSAFK